MSETSPEAVKARLRRAYDAFSERLGDTSPGSWPWLHAGVDVARGDEVPIETPLRWGPMHAAHARLTAELVGTVDLAGSGIVEVGCGRGGNLVALGRWFPTAHLVGLDLAGAAVRAVHDGLADRGVVAVHGDAEHLPFADGSRDVVVCIESAGHYPDRLRFFTEVARVLAPDGWFLYAESLGEPDRLAVGDALEACGLDLRFSADVGPRVRRYWEKVSRSEAARVADASMSDDERAAVGPGDASDLGRLLSDGVNGYFLMRWQRSSRPCDVDAVDPGTRRLVNPGGDHAASIIEAYGRGGWARSVDRPS